MNVLVIGSGGGNMRCAGRLKQSPKVKRLYALPGNGGMAQIAQCVDINVQDVEGLLQFAFGQKD